MKLLCGITGHQWEYLTDIVINVSTVVTADDRDNTPAPTIKGLWKCKRCKEIEMGASYNKHIETTKTNKEHELKRKSSHKPGIGVP